MTSTRTRPTVPYWVWLLLLIAWLLALAPAADAQTTPPPRPAMIFGMDTSGRLIAYQLGPQLSVASGKLDAVVAPSVTIPKRIVGVALARVGTTSDWALPADYTANLELFVNGLLAEPGVDYALDSTARTVRLVGTWDASTRVRASYESGTTTIRVQ